MSTAPGPLPETAPRRLDPLEVAFEPGGGRLGAVCTVAQLFEVRERSAREGRNPSTGATICEPWARPPRYTL